MTAPLERTEVAVVGGGPAGAIVGALLARAGHAVVILERRPTWRWRACGVFASPAAVTALRRLGIGLDDPTIGAVARRIPAMRVETPRGTAFRLTYGDDGSLDHAAVGFDRSALDPHLLALAGAAGADVREGVAVAGLDIRPTGSRLLIRGQAGTGTLSARIVVGADGLRSIVARATRVARPVRLGPRVGLTYHLPDTPADPRRDARMVVLRDGYAGIAPVPGGRVNVGIVLGRSWRAELAGDGAAMVARRIVERIPDIPGDAATWRYAEPCEPVAGASPLGHRVTARAGPGWFLVGDAAGFLDPFTGEGLHRAIVSARLAAPAVGGALRGDATATARYDAAMRARFRSKDVVSTVVQAFLGRPALFEYASRRLASRPDARETMSLVMGDLVPASRAVDPRYLARLLAP